MIIFAFIAEQLSYLSVPQLIGGGIILSVYLLDILGLCLMTKDY